MQPHYSADTVQAMTDAELAAELRSWARARKYVSRRRDSEGKESLDCYLLLEAADRVLITKTVYVPFPPRPSVVSRIIRSVGWLMEVLVRGSVPSWRETP